MHVRPILPAQLRSALALQILVIAAGVAGYVLIERWSWFDSFYMTITTITTIGGGEPGPLTTAGRWWTLGVIVSGVGATAYTFLAAAGYVLEGRLGTEFGLQRVRSRVRNLSGHFIICGFGRVGREIAREFDAEKMPFVIVDLNQADVTEAAQAGYLTVVGNATDVEVLREAGIERARGLITATDNDADNVYVTLSARVLRSDIFIVARANRADSDVKLRYAGADRVISPYYVGGKRMASLAMRPAAVDFIDTMLEVGNTNLLLEDMAIAADSKWVGRTLGSFAARSPAAIILALKRGADMTFRPAEDTLLAAGDEIIAAGPREAIRKFEDTT
jgi:voltage-gated potassium channel